MMAPEDVLLEAIAAAGVYGDSSELRNSACRKLEVSLKAASIPSITDAPRHAES